MRDENRAVHRVSLGERDHCLPLKNPEVGLRTLKLNFVGEPSREFASTKSNTPIDSYHRETLKEKERCHFQGKNQVYQNENVLSSRGEQRLVLGICG